MSVIHEISVIIDWSKRMAGQVEKPERCKVSGDPVYRRDFIESWIRWYCDKKCLRYSDVECWFCTGGDSIEYTRVDATHRFQREIVAGQAFEIKIVTNPGVCYVAALRAQIEKAKLESDRYEALSDALNDRMLEWTSRYEKEHRELDDVKYKLQIETDKNAEKVTELQNKIREHVGNALDLGRNINERDKLILDLQTEKDALDEKCAKYTKDLYDAHIRAQKEHSTYMLQLSHASKKRRLGAGAADEDAPDVPDVPDVLDMSDMLDNLKTRPLGERSVASLRKLIQGAGEFIQKLVEAEDAIRAAIPDSHICPITQDVMKDPVILVETGMTYERKEIEKWLEEKLDDDGNVIPPRDPKTNVILTTKKLIPNHALRNSIQEMQARV